jgi:hypothetical protein
MKMVKNHTQPFLNLGSQFFLGVIGEEITSKGSLLKGGDRFFIACLHTKISTLRVT